MTLKRQLLLLILTLAFAIVGTAYAQVEEPTPPPVADVEGVAEDIVSLTESAAETTASVIEDALDRLIQPPQNEIAQLILLIGGVVLLLVGWRIYDFIIVLAGALVGAVAGLALVADASAIIQLAALLLGGLLGALLAGFLYYFAVFFIGAYVGMVLIGALAQALDITPISPLVLLLAAVVGGLILLGLSLELLIIVSAVVGAQMVSLALGLSPELTLALTIVGILLQFVIVRAFSVDLRRRPRRMRWWRRRRA